VTFFLYMYIYYFYLFIIIIQKKIKCWPNWQICVYGGKKGWGEEGGKGHLILELQKGGNRGVKIRQNIVLINQTFNCVINRT
jgi:hypothetical protein